MIISKSVDLKETSLKYGNFSAYWYDNNCKNMDRKVKKKPLKTNFEWYKQT